MKKIILSLIASVVIFTGCSSKTPVVAEQKYTPVEIQTVYFDFDKSFIRNDQWGKVINNSIAVNQSETQGQIFEIGGYCDEWGSDEYNYALGLKRAKTTKELMIEEGKVNADRIYLVSYGESNPVCKEKTKECWVKNRRSEIKFLK